MQRVWGNCYVGVVDVKNKIVKAELAKYVDAISFAKLPSAKPPRSRKARKYPQGLPRLMLTNHIHNMWPRMASARQAVALQVPHKGAITLQSPSVLQYLHSFDALEQLHITIHDEISLSVS